MRSRCTVSLGNHPLLVMLGILAAIVVPPVMYLGPGYLLSRFINSAHRNNPCLWIFCGLIITPLVVVVCSPFFDVQSWQMFLFALACLVIARLLPKKHPHVLNVFTTLKPITSN